MSLDVLRRLTFYIFSLLFLITPATLATLIYYLQEDLKKLDIAEMSFTVSFAWSVFVILCYHYSLNEDDNNCVQFDILQVSLLMIIVGAISIAGGAFIFYNETLKTYSEGNHFSLFLLDIAVSAIYGVAIFAILIFIFCIVRDKCVVPIVRRLLNESNNMTIELRDDIELVTE